MKYTAKYFRDNLPASKNSKSSFLVRHFYRKVSFYFSEWAYRAGLTANQVSFIGTILAYLAAAMFLVPNKYMQIAGAIVTGLWLVSDCVDGNLARCVGKQSYGEFIDACGSYTIVALILPTVSFAAYDGGSLFLNNNPWIVLLGGLAGLFDALARLYYQKYTNEKNSIENSNVDCIKSNNEKTGRLYSIYMRLSKEIGISGLMIPFLLIATIWNWLDIFVVFYFLFYGANYFAAFAVLLKKTECLKKP